MFGFLLIWLTISQTCVLQSSTQCDLR
eukprot:UN17947